MFCQCTWLMPPPSVRESRGTARMRGTRCSATVSGASARQLMKNLAAGVSEPARPPPMLILRQKSTASQDCNVCGASRVSAARHGS